MVNNLKATYGDAFGCASYLKIRHHLWTTSNAESEQTLNRVSLGDIVHICVSSKSMEPFLLLKNKSKPSLLA